jgi:SAM-dependent MidA family methyltransferase
VPLSIPPASGAELPQPTPEARDHSARLIREIRREIEAHGGALPFDRYMELVLYSPALGYYTAGARKFGAEGDFVTAPEISPVFGRCLARQAKQILRELDGGDLLEFGAGTGRLAADMLAELEILGSLPEHYFILELSPELQQRQRQTIEDRIPHLSERVVWLQEPPTAGFRGLVVANEVLDAMPVHRFRFEPQGISEQYVEWKDERFRLCWRPPKDPTLEQAVAGLDLEPGYESEINQRAAPWVRQLSDTLEAGVVILIDYGYPRAEFYHPQRNSGTLMCHYRHLAHSDPLVYPGLQDITAHVDFTAVAEAAQRAGLRVCGYTSQAFFLMGCGLDQIMGSVDPQDTGDYLDLVQGVKRLTLPTEMGERFKVLALCRNMEQPLLGFNIRDARERL